MPNEQNIESNSVKVSMMQSKEPKQKLKNELKL